LIFIFHGYALNVIHDYDHDDHDRYDHDRDDHARDDHARGDHAQVHLIFRYIIREVIRLGFLVLPLYIKSL